MTLTTKGQVTIPQDIRLALGLQPGTRVVFDIVGHSVRIRKAVDQSRGAALPSEYYERRALPWEAAFLAGRTFVRYRRRSGQRRSPLPAFCIGAHALVGRMTLLTRDARRYRTYFPALRIIAP